MLEYLLMVQPRMIKKSKSKISNVAVVTNTYLILVFTLISRRSTRVFLLMAQSRVINKSKAKILNVGVVANSHLILVFILISSKSMVAFLLMGQVSTISKLSTNLCSDINSITQMMN
jgi:hypothetical protein